MRGQGRIFRRGRIWWVAYYHRGKEIRESTHSAKDSNAKRLLRERLRTAGTPHFVGPRGERTTFDDVAAGYLADYRLHGRRSLRDAKRAVRWLATFFGPDRAIDITPARIVSYAESRLRDDAARATVNRELSALRRMLRLALRAGMMTTIPHVQMLDGENVREGFSEPAEFAAIASGLPDDLADFSWFAYLTSWRKGEISTLRISDIDWQARDLSAATIRLRTEHSKNNRPRKLVVRTGLLLEIIQRRWRLRRPGCPYLFHRNGRQIRDFRKRWTRACEAAGVTGRLFHDLRRSGVRNMVRANNPTTVAMKVSGHRTRSVFDRYDIVSEDDLASATERTSAYVEGRRDEPPIVVPVRQGKRQRG